MRNGHGGILSRPAGPRGKMPAMFPLPLPIRLNPSRHLRVLWLLTLLLALVAIWLADLATGWRALVSGALLVGGFQLLRVETPLDLRCKADGQLEMRVADEWRVVAVDEASMALPVLTVLRYHHDGHWRARVVLADSLPAEDYRRFRVWLRWRARLGAPT